MNELLLTQVKALAGVRPAPTDFHSFAINCAHVYENILSSETTSESVVELYAIAQILKSDEPIWAMGSKSNWVKKLFTGPEYEHDAKSFETGDIGYVYAYPVSIVKENAFLEDIDLAIRGGSQSAALVALSVLGTGLPTWDDEFEREETPAIYVIRLAVYRILRSIGKEAVDIEVLPIVFADGTIEDFSQEKELALYSTSFFTSPEIAANPINEFLIRGVNPGSLDRWIPDPVLIKMSHGFNYACEVTNLELIGFIVHDLLSVLLNDKQGVEYWETYFLLNEEIQGSHWFSKLLSQESTWKWLRNNPEVFSDNFNTQEMYYLLELCAAGKDVRREYSAITVDALKSSNFRTYFDSN